MIPPLVQLLVAGLKDYPGNCSAPLEGGLKK
jgi:hypothetical protein